MNFLTFLRQYAREIGVVIPRNILRILKEALKNDGSLVGIEAAIPLFSTRSQQELELQSCLFTAVRLYKERRDVPATTTIKEEGTREVTMYLDCRGEAGYRDRMADDVKEHTKVVKLQRGDCTIRAGQKCLWTAERKTISDLALSLSDGRLYRQALSKKEKEESDYDHPYTLLLEDCQSAVLNRPDLLQLLMRRLPKGTSVVHTSTPDGTAMLYSEVYSFLAQSPNTKEMTPMQEVASSSEWETFIRTALRHRDATHADAFLREFPSCATLREKGPTYARMRIEALGIERDFASEVSELAHPL
ncbi:ERCC4 domain-containing protein [Giardia muris]|uniref:ERCC4 domain-containing protein n=1 Tax=Giardia muris TaxID=5742 RepID=A0A4Z1STY6_GIAMU|nr:ERCC4 domain-containing protein [Giardia muris]|eukprot:TNJ29324.1 ERCC4 domain-containing protein [Giardia muris]